MSSPRYDWWGYVKKVIRRYPNCQTAAERAAVEKALDDLHSTGRDVEREKALISLMYWGKVRYNAPGAATVVHVSESTAKRWNQAFIKSVAANLNLTQ